MVKPFQKSAATLPAGMRVKAPTVDLAGTKIGRLTPVEVVGKAKSNSLMWRCTCTCGGEIVRSSANIRKAGPGASCGCALGNRRRGLVPWNHGKTYANAPPGAEYKSNGAWSEALRRERGEACERCGWAEARCDTHHVTPQAEGGKNTLDNGLVLCPNCHRVEHERREGRL